MNISSIRRKQIHIYLLPNASLSVPQQFIFKFKGSKVAKVEKTEDKRFLVKEVYDEDIILLNDKLRKGRLLMYSRLTKKHELLPVAKEDYDLYNSGHMKLAKIRVPEHRTTNESVKYQWMVKEVYLPKDTKKIISGERLLSGNILSWSEQPRNYYWIPCSADEQFASLRDKYRKDYEKDRNIIGKINALEITHLKLYEWLKYDSEGHPKQIPYGQFRQQLLNAAKNDMKKFHEGGKYVYMMPFDPDCKSILVKRGTNLFDMYIHNIHRYHYPSIMTSGFTFTSRYVGLNRIFQLNRELQIIFQEFLPGSAYYSECNSIIRYNPDFIEDKYFKFGLYGTEILPIIKYIAAKNCPMIILQDAPLVTTVPSRILDVMPVEDQWKTLSRDYYEKILQLSQIVISTHNFMSGLISGLSIHIQTNSRLRSYLCELWKFHCPLLIIQENESTPSSDYISKLRSLCEKYEKSRSMDNKKYVQSLAEIRQRCIREMPTPKKQTNSSEQQTRDTLIDKCIEISRKCGQLCAFHILQWISIHRDNV